MSLKDDAPRIATEYRKVKDTLCTNHILLDIYEGCLLPYVLDDLKQQLSPKAYESASKRVPPINLLKRLIDKLSTIYLKEPAREVVGSQTDQDMWDGYIEDFSLDVQMQLANEYFNMHKACALEPYLNNEFEPCLRVLPYDRFFVCSFDMTDPLRVTQFIKVMGLKEIKRYKESGEEYYESKMILFVYSDDEFLIIDEEGEVQTQMMADYGADGTNQYGRIPFVYINRSQTKTNPTSDSDLLAMTKLVPVMLTDLNYALMFQSFSLFYTIDVEQEKFEMNPNTWINLKSDKEAGTDPKIGSISPTVDSDKLLGAIKEQIGLWLQSRNIRPGSTGAAMRGAVAGSTSEMSVSGISKMVDEMDTTQERKKTIPFFMKAELALFDLITQYIHPIWLRNPGYEYKSAFTSTCIETVQFSEQIIDRTRQDVLNEVTLELSAGLVSKETAMAELNPEWEPEQIQEELAKIASERSVTVPNIQPNNQPPGNNNGNPAPEVQPKP